MPAADWNDEAGIEKLAQNPVEIVEGFNVYLVLVGAHTGIVPIHNAISIDMQAFRVDAAGLRGDSIGIGQVADFGMAKEQQVRYQSSSRLPKSILNHLYDFTRAH